MRIRRRPQAQAQALIPSPSPPPQQASSDPSTAPSQPHWLPRKEEDEAALALEKRWLHPNVDLGGEPSPSPLPSETQANNVVLGRSGENPQGHRGGGGGAARRQAGAAAADGHTANGRLENGHLDEYEWLVINAGEEGPVNGAMPATPLTSPAAAAHAKEGSKGDGPKRRRGPAVLLEGSRCSRVNGRGWRCSQPTLVGYALCEHHLGKGRQSRSANGGGGRSTGGVPKLGRTEPAGGRKSAATALAVVAADPAAHLTAASQFG